MAARPFWKGYMKLSLVTCPVAMMSATSEEEKVRFHVLNRRTDNRIQSHYVDAETGKPVDEANEVKGYARGEDDYVLLEDEELESVALESARTIDIQSFVAAESIDWIWYDTPYYLTPDNPDRRGGLLRHSRRHALDRDGRGVAARSQSARTGGDPETAGQRDCALDAALRR
jgi:DNA end-binding protein Ku